MKIRNLLPVLLLLSSFETFAQTNKYTKLEIKHNEVFEVGLTNMLLADTLIMHDKATIKFSSETAGILQANHAIVGEKCTISSRGANGINSNSKTNGTAGQDGGDLDISLYFAQLGSLTIDTQGGRGGDGKKGRNGASGEAERMEEKEVRGADGKTSKVIVVIPAKSGTNGSDATTGLNGGNGGDIYLTYSTKNFIPVFNNSKARNSIILIHTAGNSGKNGEPGKGGVNSTDGKLIQVNRVETTDGQIRLINLNGAAAQE